MTIFNPHPAFDYEPSHSDELRWATDRTPRIKIPSYLLTEALDEAGKNTVQVDDSGKSAEFSLYKGFKRNDNRDFWKPRMTENRTHWRSGLYGDSINAVNWDRKLAGIKGDVDVPNSAWNLWGLLSYGQESEWGTSDYLKGLINPVSSIQSSVKLLARTRKFLYNNWNFETTQAQLINKGYDPQFEKSLSKVGWTDAIDKEFEDQADLVREALLQNGWNPEEDGQGTANAQHYMYTVKRRLREIYLNQWATSRYDKQRFLTGKDSSGFWGDFGKGMVLDIFTDYEILVDIPATVLTGGIGKVVSAAGVVAKTSAALRGVATGIKKGKYAGGMWQWSTVSTGIGMGGKQVVPVTKKVRVFQLFGKNGKTIGEPLMEHQVEALTKMGLMTNVPQLSSVTRGAGAGTRIMDTAIVSNRYAGGAFTPVSVGGRVLPHQAGTVQLAQGFFTTETTLIGKSTLAQTLKLHGSKALLEAGGWAGATVGGTLEFLGFMSMGRNIGVLGKHAAGAGVWGAGTGVGFSLGVQEDRKLMADLTYGMGNHDVTFSGGEVLGHALMFGGAGFALGGAMSGFTGGFFKHYWKGAKQYGWTNRKEWYNKVLKKSETTRFDGSPEGLVGQWGEEQAFQYIAGMLDQVAAEGGHGARLLDKKLIEKNWLLADDIAQILELFLDKMNGHHIPIEALEPIIMKYIADMGRGRPASIAERVANSKKKVAELWRKVETEVKESSTGRPRLNEAIPTRNYGDLSWKQKAELGDLRETLNIIRSKGNKELGKNNKLSDETKKAYDDAIDALEKWHEGNKIPLLPTENIASIRFKEYDWTVTEPGAHVSRLIGIADSIKAATQRGAGKDELAPLQKQFQNGLDALDKQYARKDKLTRKEVLEKNFSLLMTEVRNAGDEITASVKERLLNNILEKMSDNSSQGSRAHSTGWFDDVMNDSALGRGLTSLASMGTGYADMVYSIAHEIRMLARMVDNSHEALADDIGMFGRMRSVWSAQRQAFRDGGHVVTSVNRAETDIGIANTSFIQKLINTKRVAKEELTIDDFSHAYQGKELDDIFKHATNIYEETNRYFGSQLEKGIEVQLLKKGLDSERYLPMMFVDTMTDAYIETVGRRAWEIKAEELLKHDTMTWSELEPIGLINLLLDEDTGRIAGIHSIPEDSFLHLPGATLQQMEDLLRNITREELRAWQAIADRKRIAEGLEVHPNRLDNLSIALEKQRLSANKMSPEAPLQYYTNTKGRYLNAVNAEDLSLAAKELYTMIRQTSEFKRFNVEEAVSHRAFAEERLAALEKEHGITIEDPMGQVYTKDSTWHVDKGNWHSAKPGAPTKEPTVIAVNLPEIRQNGAIIREANVVVSEIVGPQDIPTIGFLRPLEEGLGIERGQMVVHSPTSGNPKFTEPTAIESVTINISKENLEATRVNRANEIYKEIYLDDVTKGILTKEEGHAKAIADAQHEIRVTPREEWTHAMVKVKGVEELIPSHELQTLGVNGSPEAFSSLTEGLRYNSIYGATDYELLGAKDLTALIESLSGKHLQPIDMGITKEFLKRSGITNADLVEHLSTNKAMREFFEFASQNSIDISPLVVRYLQEVVVKSNSINKANIVSWLKNTNPTPNKTTMFSSIGQPQKLREAIEIANSGSVELRDILPNFETLIERKVISIDDDGIIILRKPLEGEDLEVYLAAVEVTKSKYDSGLTHQQKELIRTEKWDELAGNIDNILARIYDIKQGFINDNLARIASGEDTITNKVAMEAAIQTEFPGLKLWNPKDDIGDELFTKLVGSSKKWEESLQAAHATGIRKEADDYIGPRPPEPGPPKEPDFISPDEIASHLSSPESITHSLDNKAAKTNPKKLTKKQKVEKHFPESTPDQLNNKKYIATKMVEVKRIEYLENVDARITSMLGKVNKALEKSQAELGVIRELSPEVQRDHFGLVTEELDLRVSLLEAQNRREHGGFDKEVNKLELEIDKKIDTMLHLSDADVAARIKSDTMDFQDALPKAYRGQSEEQVKVSIQDLKRVREQTIKRKNKSKDSNKAIALAEERRLTDGINKLEYALDIAAYKVTSYDNLMTEYQIAVGKLEDRLLQIQGTRKRFDPTGDELVNRAQRLLDKNIAAQKKLVPVDTLEARIDRLILDKERIEFIRTLRRDDYDISSFNQQATLHELLDTPVHWWQQGRLAKDAKIEIAEDLAKLRTEADANLRKVMGAGKDVFSEGNPKKGATVGNYNKALKDFPSKAEELQENLAMIAFHYGLKKGWFGEKAGTGLGIASPLAQEMLGIIQELTTLASLSYTKFNATPAEIILDAAHTLGMGSMTTHNSEYLVNNLFAYNRLWDPDTNKFINTKRKRGERFTGGENNSVPLGLLIYHAANELRRRKGLRGHSTEMVQFPRPKREEGHGNSPYDDVTDAITGEWVGADTRFADPFNYEHGSNFGKPLATLFEIAGKKEFDDIINAYFSLEGLSPEAKVIKERQYALVRLISEEDKGGSRILRRGAQRREGDDPEVKTESRIEETFGNMTYGAGRKEEFPYRSPIYTKADSPSGKKAGSLIIPEVVKMLKDRGLKDITASTVKEDLRALQKFYGQTISAMEHMEGVTHALTTPERFRQWLDQNWFVDDIDGKSASNLLHKRMDGDSLIESQQAFGKTSKSLEAQLSNDVLTEVERALLIKKMQNTITIYSGNYNAFLDNIIIHASDPVRYMTERLANIEGHITKPRYSHITNNKWFVKHGWAKPDVYRNFIISKGSLSEFNKLNIEKAVIKRKLLEIREDIHTTVARDIDVLVAPTTVAKWLPDVEHGETLFRLKDLLEGDGIRKKDFLTLHSLTDEQWKKAIYPQLVKLRKEGFVESALISGTKMKGWQLTQKGRDHVGANEVITINVHTANKSLSPEINSELFTNAQIKKLLGISNGSSIKIAPRDKFGFTAAQRTSYNNLITLQRNARDRGDVKLMAGYEAEIRTLKAQVITAETEVGFMLMKELRSIYRELKDIRNMKAYGQEAGPKAFEQFKDLTKIYNEATKRVKFLEVRKHAIIGKLQKVLGKRTYDPSEFKFEHSSIFSTAQTKPLASVADVGDEISSSAMAQLLQKFEKIGITADDINPNYRGATDSLTAADKYDAALRGDTQYYGTKRAEKLGDGRTALQEALHAWAKRMNGERAGTGLGFEPTKAGRYQSGGDPHLGDHSRVFDAELLAKYPDFMDFFESDIRKIVANYARTMGSQIRAQEVLNDWLQHLAVGVDKRILKNLRWDDVFNLMEAKMRNITEIINKDGSQTISKAERDALVDSVNLARNAYYDMIGRPVHEGWRKMGNLTKGANNMAQTMFGPGISTAVALVEFPMAIVARSGDLGGLANGMAVAGRNIKHMNTLERSDLEGTAFVLDNYIHSGLNRYLASGADDMESRVSARIRVHWSRMFEGSDRASPLAKAMDNINNFLEGTAKIGSELSGLRQAINFVKAIAVGKAKYAIMKNTKGLMAFGELLDINELKLATEPKARTKYIKGVARAAGVDPTLAFRWFRAGLVGNNDGLTINTVVKNLLEMGSTLEGKSFDLGKMWKGMKEMEHAVGAGKAFYEDVFDRLALFLELHAHDLSPEPRGLVRFGFYNSPLGRLFAFYASYPVSFFMTYFKKNPSEMGTLAALTAILTLSGFEMFHQQVRALSRGDDWDETKDKWAEHPWAMMFKHGSATPWFGYTHSLLREMFFLPQINRFTGDRNYPVTVGRTAGLGAVETVFSAIQDMSNGNILTRGANKNTKGMRSIDYLATGGNFANGQGGAQASKVLDAMYDLVLPNRAFYWVMVDRLFDHSFKPEISDTQQTIMRAYAPLIQTLQESGDTQGLNTLMEELDKLYFPKSLNQLPAHEQRSMPAMPSRETPLFNTGRRPTNTSAPKPKFFQPKKKTAAPIVSRSNLHDVVAQLEDMPTYSSIPEDLV